MGEGDKGREHKGGVSAIEKSGNLTYTLDPENSMRSDPVKSARLDTRITPDLLNQVRRAAELQGRSVSDYVAATLQAAVQRDIAEVEIIRLSREASEKFAAALINPPPINASLKRAFAHHRRLVKAK
jgi:uncharacterized protein (DUF1778 family)